MTIIRIEDLNRKPKIQVTNITIEGAEKIGSIYWAAKDVQLVVSADCELPDGTLMLIVERFVGGETVVDDTRTPITIRDGKMTASITFDSTGSWKLTPERLNKGLDVVGSPVHLEFKVIEFDIYS